MSNIMKVEFGIVLIFIDCLRCFAGIQYMIHHPETFRYYFQVKQFLADGQMSKMSLEDKLAICQDVAQLTTIVSVEQITSSFYAEMDTKDALLEDISKDFEGYFFRILNDISVIPAAVPEAFKQPVNVVPCIFNGPRILFVSDGVTIFNTYFVLWSQRIVGIPIKELDKNNDKGGYVMYYETQNRKSMQRITDVMGMVENSPDIVLTTGINIKQLEYAFLEDNNQGPNFCALDDFTRHRICSGAFVTLNSLVPSEMRDKLTENRHFMLRGQKDCTNGLVKLITKDKLVETYHMIPCAIDMVRPLFYIKSDYTSMEKAYVLIKDEETGFFSVYMSLDNIKAYVESLM